MAKNKPIDNYTITDFESDSTIRQLETAGIIYDQLVMGFGGGDRILINDRKSNSDRNTAMVINLDRDTGMSDLDL